jgi:LPXTG-motif cell wall-anchored protein
VRDQVLLGVAGAAVVAALGIAYRRRKPDELRAWE